LKQLVAGNGSLVVLQAGLRFAARRSRAPVDEAPCRSGADAVNPEAVADRAFAVGYRHPALEPAARLKPVEYPQRCSASVRRHSVPVCLGKIR